MRITAKPSSTGWSTTRGASDVRTPPVRRGAPDMGGAGGAQARSAEHRRGVGIPHLDSRWFGIAAVRRCRGRRWGLENPVKRPGDDSRVDTAVTQLRELSGRAEARDALFYAVEVEPWGKGAGERGARRRKVGMGS